MTTSRALVGKTPSGKPNATSTSQAKSSIWRAETNAIRSFSPSYSFADMPLYDGNGHEKQIPHPFRLPWPMQAKLEVGAPNDPLEHEADHIADRIMRMPDARPAVSPVPSHLQRKCSCGGSCEKCKAAEDDKNGQLQRKPAETAVPEHTSIPPSVHRVLRSSGQPLDEKTRAFFEPRFGYDFANVRVHA